MRACVRCGRDIPRKIKWSFEYYSTRKYCSHACRRKPPAPRKPPRYTDPWLPVRPIPDDPVSSAWALSLAPQVRRRINITPGCWLWTGAMSRGGYGNNNGGDRQGTVPAHRLVYTVLVGEIPDGLHLDHLCRTHACVRPDHLEPVTNHENSVRGVNKGARAWSEDRCMRGHDLTDEANIYRPPSNPTHRHCRECGRIYSNRYKARQQQRKAA